MNDVLTIKQDFPILHQDVNGHPLVYLDNAATTQKPNMVIDALDKYYKTVNSNVHRGAHALADQATKDFEATREKIRQFLNAAHQEEIIFTRGTTEAINLVSKTFGKKFIGAGDEIIISTMEHHSNIVPWQMLCEENGAILKVIPINDKGEIIYEEFLNLLSDKTKMVSIVHASNALGTVNPVERIIEDAHKVDAKVLIDGAQSSPHLTVDVQKMDCDFYVFSAHKVYGPTGIGALYGKKELLEAMPPFHGGGEMIKEVTFEKTTYNELPYKFEAGTPNIGDTIAFGAAIDFVNQVGKSFIAEQENKLLAYATEKLSKIERVRLIGTADHKVSVVSFIIEGIHPYDVGMMLDARGIAVRTGHHCTQPLMQRFGLEGTVRASFAVYNTLEDVDKLVEGIKRIIQMFG
ncbi:cysteine desulfurase [Algivirga pacifica]|uniref:Cysteine desulfurase n=1 Tax=Algivirga pacifica TaxID=1162670 RepID=A0ABP9DPI8_9BACT